MRSFFAGFGDELLKLAQPYDPFGKQTAKGLGIPGAGTPKSLGIPGPSPQRVAQKAPAATPPVSTGGTGGPAPWTAAGRMAASQKASRQVKGSLGLGTTSTAPVQSATPNAPKTPGTVQTSTEPQGQTQTKPPRMEQTNPVSATAASAQTGKRKFDLGRHSSAVFGRGGGSPVPKKFDVF